MIGVAGKRISPMPRAHTPAQSYAYDSASRLQTITSGSQTATYAYHPNSGLLNTATFSGGTNIARGYDALGRIQSMTNQPAAGAAQSYNYTYNSLNQRTPSPGKTTATGLASVPVEAKSRSEFAYDYLGRRIQKKSYNWNAGTSSYQLQAIARFVYDQWDLISEFDGSNLPIRSYNWGITGLLSINESGVAYQVGYDGSGNVTLLVNSSTGAIAGAYDYDPFGVNIMAAGNYAANNPFRYSAQYTDQETGLIYYGYRYYNEMQMFR
jgi:uncharacterized protein RhaS with RHS repeats